MCSPGNDEHVIDTTATSDVPQDELPVDEGWEDEDENYPGLGLS